MRPEPVLGCVYVPSDAGFAMWSRWSRSRIERDLARIRAEGFGAVRVFVIWRDFEPEPGSYDAAAFGRLRELVECAEREGLLCVPAVLTLFMNGELLDLPWRGGRDLWSDRWMRRRAREFVAEVASTLRGSANVFAYDIGDELIHVDLEAAERLSRAEAEDWQREMGDAIRGAHPGVPVFLGCDASAVFGTHPFGVDNATALDLLGVHAFPNFAPLPLDGVADPLSSLLPGFLVRYASAFGAPLVDELGSYGASPELIAGHLRAAGASALAAGARGLFAWFWRDGRSVEPPYDRRPHERDAGLVDAAGEAKPGLAAARRLGALVTPLASGAEAPSPVGILVAERRADPGNYLSAEVATAAQAAFGAYVILTQEKLPVEFVRQPQPHTKLLICPGCERLGSAELAMVEGFLAAGGHVWLSIFSPLVPGAVAELCGGAATDFTVHADGRRSLFAAGEELPVDWSAGGRHGSMPVWKVREGEVVADFADGGPAVWSRSHGSGRVWMGQLPLELQPLSARTAGREVRWGRFYAQAAAAAGIAPVAGCAEPWLELRLREGSEGPRLLAVNHSSAALRANVERGPARVELALAGKDFELIELPVSAPAPETVSAGGR
jgi:hypothetical protein